MGSDADDEVTLIPIAVAPASPSPPAEGGKWSASADKDMHADPGDDTIVIQPPRPADGARGYHRCGR